MKTLLTVAIVACFGRSYGQVTDSAKAVISHVFFCVDSVSYQNFFKYEFITELFAYTSESSSKTLTDSWTGKYLMGRQSYIEVFADNYKGTNPQLGDKFGDVGIVFRTKKPDDVHKIDASARADKRETHLELMKYESDGKVVPFNYNLYLSNAAVQEVFRPYVEEFTTEFLKLCGFADNEIRAGITEEQFREKRRGKKYEKLYDHIKKIELSLTLEEYQYLAESLRYFGFLQVENRFTNGDLQIICSVQGNRRYKLKAIHFALRDQTESTNIQISKNVTFIANGTNASLEFNY